MVAVGIVQAAQQDVIKNDNIKKIARECLPCDFILFAICMLFDCLETFFAKDML